LPSIQSVLGVFWIHSSVMGSDDWQNVTSKKHRRSKEDDVCSAYGTVVDVFIPFKKSKAGKRFAFVRFIKVFNLDRLVENLCTIWIGRFHLFANHVRFDRPQKPNHSPPKVPTTAHKNSFAAVLKDSNVKEASVEPAIVLDDSCIKEFDFNLSLMGSFKQKAGGSIIDLMDELVNVGRAMGYKMDGCLGNKAKRRWINGLCHKHRINFMSLQETKMEDIDVCTIKEVWGNMYFDHVVGPSVGFSGGIASRISYLWPPKKLSEKTLDLRNYLVFFISRNGNGATAFNQFISSSSLIDPPLDGYAFTWSHKNASKMSKLDRFLLSEGLFDFFPHLSAICLDKNLSDHRPILLRESCLDYGPTPFRFFHSWFSLDGFDAFVENTWNSLMVSDDNALIRLQRKLQLLKIAIKSWTKEFRLKSNAKKCQIQQDILCLDKLFDLGLINDDSLNKRALLLNELHEINSVNASELSQKAKIRLVPLMAVITQNSLTGRHYKKRAQLAIRGILADGNWISEPSLVKNEFFHHFSKQFSSPPSSYICLDYEFPVRLTSDQVEDLESEISNEEVKAAVLGCCDVNIYPAVKAFFANGCFPRGCNSSFIALIPKIQDAKFMKFFCPISLIGSTYKIISKILANRLCLVLPDLISDVQSAFCGFRKAFDSVKWGLLDEIMKFFSDLFEWRNWISGCLNNAKGSVLVNGNPTKEFQFFKGLKQGDPLSPFLFILVMETLHLSFKRIINGGLYRGHSSNQFRGLVLSNIEDRWSLEGSGLFSVKSSRAYIDDLLLPKADAATRWIRILPIKINVFAWKVCFRAVENIAILFSFLARWFKKVVAASSDLVGRLDVSSFHSYNEWIILAFQSVLVFSLPNS
ncbi:RNA-directed DNA polymerase, eukaryota, partial [Tanacetum coccineum]